MKMKKMQVLLGTALSLMMLVGFAQSKTELMGGSYVRFGEMKVGTSKSNLVNVVDDQVYFIADGSNENITEYCSMDDYYIKQLVEGDYMHTVVIGGDISQLGFANQIQFIGEHERELIDGNTERESVYSFPAIEPTDPNIPPEFPNWFVNACNDYDITNTDTFFDGY